MKESKEEGRKGRVKREKGWKRKKKKGDFQTKIILSEDLRYFLTSESKVNIYSIETAFLV